MAKTRGPSPGAARYPGHEVTIAEADSRYVVRIGDTALAGSDEALIVRESGYDPVVYFPVPDVRMDRLAATDSASTCPFKGEATYFALADGPDGQDVAWTYPVVYDEVADLTGRIAFYADRVEVLKASIETTT